MKKKKKSRVTWWRPWWNRKDYTILGRRRIINVLKEAGLIQRTALLEFSEANSEIFNPRSKYFNLKVTLLLKRGIDVLPFLKKMVLDLNRPLSFGAIIIDGGFYKHSIGQVKKFLFSQGYKLTFQHKYKGPNLEYSIPYALGPAKEVAVFIKK